MTRREKGQLRKLLRDILYGQRKRWWTLEMLLRWAETEMPRAITGDDVTEALEEDIREGLVDRRVDRDTREPRWRITAEGINRVLED